MKVCLKRPGRTIRKAAGARAGVRTGIEDHFRKGDSKMKKNSILTPKSMEALAKEWKERIEDIPLIIDQLRITGDNILSSDTDSDDNLNLLENAFQCVMDSLEYYPSKIRTYIKRCAKLPDMETPENLEAYKSIRDEADQIIGQIEDMKETFYRQIQFQNLANGVYFPLQNCKEIEIPPAPDEENE